MNSPEEKEKKIKKITCRSFLLFCFFFSQVPDNIKEIPAAKLKTCFFLQMLPKTSNMTPNKKTAVLKSIKNAAFLAASIHLKKKNLKIKRFLKDNKICQLTRYSHC